MGENPSENLAVVDGVPQNLDLFAHWRLKFYAGRGVWRRTRASRDELPRSKVAREVGVEEELIRRWEQAVTSFNDREPPQNA